MGWFFILHLISSSDYSIQVATIGLLSHTISKLLHTSQSHAIHTVRYGIALAAGLSSVSIARTWAENLHMIPTTGFTRGRLMERAVCRSFGVLATGAMAF